MNRILRPIKQFNGRQISQENVETWDRGYGYGLWITRCQNLKYKIIKERVETNSY